MTLSFKSIKFLPCFLLTLSILLPAATPCRSDSTLIISGHPDYPPYMWNQDSQLLGIGAELIKTICLELNQKCEMRPIDSWKRVQELVRSGEIDILIGAYTNEDRRSYMEYSIAYMQDPTSIFVHKNRSFSFTTREDLIGRRGVAMFGESYGQELDLFITDKLQLSRTYTTEAAFKNLQSGQVDYMLWGYYPWLIHAHPLNATTWCEILPNPIVEEGMHLTFSKKSSSRTLLPQVNEIIKRLQENGTIKMWRNQLMQDYRQQPAGKNQ